MLDLRVKTCCFTGHRIIPSGEKETIRNLLETAVEKAIQDGYRFFGAGGALDFDTMAAQTVVRFKRQYPHIRLLLVLPCSSLKQKDGNMLILTNMSVSELWLIRWYILQENTLPVVCTSETVTLSITAAYVSVI